MNETRAERHFLLDEVVRLKGEKGKEREYSIAIGILKRFVKQSPVSHKVIDGVSTDARPLLLLDEEEGDTIK